MTPAIARLIRCATQDGIIEFRQEVEFGRIYLVDLDSVRKVTLFETEKRRFHTGECVIVYPNLGWIPFECVQLELPS